MMQNLLHISFAQAKQINLIRDLNLSTKSQRRVTLFQIAKYCFWNSTKISHFHIHETKFSGFYSMNEKFT